MTMTVEMVKDYVKPELLVLVVVLYFVGMALKKAKAVKDELIPAILGLLGVVLAFIWVIATTAQIVGVQAWAMVVFTAIVQGILVAGLAVYINQLTVQAAKAKEGAGNE